MLSDLLVALGLSLSPPAWAEPGACPAGSASYAIAWTSNVNLERNASGVPTRAWAVSPDGPALAVALDFADPFGAFAFDRPRAAGAGRGHLEIAQSLPHGSAFTEAVLSFDRPVHTLTLALDGLDRTSTAGAVLEDRVGAMGMTGTGWIFPTTLTDGIEAAQEDLRADLGREPLRKAAGFGPGGMDGPVVLRFKAAVHRVHLRFGQADAVTGHPVMAAMPQDMQITDVTFCARVPTDSLSP